MNETSDDKLQLAIGDYLRRLDAGEAVDREAFISDYPDQAAGLREHFAVDDLLAEWAGPTAVETYSLRSGGDTVGHSSRKFAVDAFPWEFGRYQILGKVGEGGMGSVFRAEDRELQREVALKIPHLGNAAPHIEQDRVERFYREARSAATLLHPNICTVYDVNEHSGMHFITMAFIDGETLAHYISPDKLPSETATAILIRKLARALAAAHERGIVHRDLKPSNIMIDNAREPIITDFGLAARMDVDERLTTDSALLGSPAYMSPEQAGEQGDVGPASDVYSLGVVFYETLTGQRPFSGSIATLLSKIVADTPDSPCVHRPDLHSDLESLCLRMMAKSADNRPTMEQVAAELSTWLGVQREKGIKTAIPIAPPPAPPVSKSSSAVSENRPLVKPMTSPRRPRSDWKIPTVAVGVIVLATLLAAGVFFMKTENGGTVRIAVDDPNAKIFIDGNKIQIQREGDTVHLEAGRHQLTVKRGDVVVQTDDFQIQKGKQTVLRVTLEPPPETVANNQQNRVEDSAQGQVAATPPAQLAAQTTTPAYSEGIVAVRETPWTVAPAEVDSLEEVVEVEPFPGEDAVTTVDSTIPSEDADRPGPREPATEPELEPAVPVAGDVPDFPDVTIRGVQGPKLQVQDGRFTMAGKGYNLRGMEQLLRAVLKYDLVVEGEIPADALGERGPISLQDASYDEFITSLAEFYKSRGVEFRAKGKTIYLKAPGGGEITEKPATTTKIPGRGGGGLGGGGGFGGDGRQ